MSAQDGATDRALARTGSRLLGAGALLAVASFGLTAIAFAVLALVDLDPIVAWVWWATALLGVPAVWYALRVRLDAALFRDLARAPLRDGETMAHQLAALDAALRATGLVHGDRSRPLVERLQGAKRLLWRQGAVAAAQFACALVAALPT